MRRSSFFSNVNGYLVEHLDGMQLYYLVSNLSVKSRSDVTLSLDLALDDELSCLFTRILLTFGLLSDLMAQFYFVRLKSVKHDYISSFFYTSCGLNLL